MSARINHFAVWVAAVVYFAWGFLWYGIIFGATWMALLGKQPADFNPSALVYGGSFALGLILAYATALALTRRPDDQTVAQGISFALFMGIALYAGQTLNHAIYEMQPFKLWLLNTAYTVIGFAIIGAIVGGWKKPSA